MLISVKVGRLVKATIIVYICVCYSYKLFVLGEKLMQTIRFELLLHGKSDMKQNSVTQ